uniref:MHC class I-like antigen recognition-like domain-containing protein n=1 Tax=Phocoena sinus TaxID=42100 RepID=A0A8C9C1A1_PHOSS
MYPKSLLMPWSVGLSLQGVFPQPCPSCAGSHSLHYNLTALTRDGSVQSSFFAGGHLDGQALLRYDRETGRVQPQGLWAEELGAETWDTESKDLTETWKDFRELLAEILALQEEKGGEKSLLHQSQWWTILGVAAFALVFIIGPCVLCYSKKKKTALAVGSPAVSLQDLDQCQMQPSDHNGLTQLGFQSSLSDPVSISSTGGA